MKNEEERRKIEGRRKKVECVVKEGVVQVQKQIFIQTKTHGPRCKCAYDH